LNYRLRPVLLGCLALAIPLAIDIASLDPGIDYWDTGELQTVPYILGIPHPTGFPAYVLLGWLWTHALPLGSVAYRMNLLSAVGTSLASLALYAAARVWGVNAIFALGAALVFAVSRIVWDHAVHADVHAVAIAAFGASVWLALWWQRDGAARVLVACAAVCGGAIALHSALVLVVPGVAVLALARTPPLRLAAVAVATGAAIVVAFYAYLPIRSAVVFAQRSDPTLVLGLAPGRPFWDNDHPSTWAGFRAEVGGGEFGAARALGGSVSPAVLAQLPARFGRDAASDLALGLLAIAAAGVVVMARRSWWCAAGIVAAGLLPVLFVLSFSVESDPDRYFMPAYFAISLLVAVGADALARGGLERAPAPVLAVVGALFGVVVFANVLESRNRFWPRGYTSTQALIDRVIRRTPDNAVIVASWNDATVLAYGAYVERRFGHRILVTGWPPDYLADYPQWVRERPVIIISDGTLDVPGFTLRDRDPLALPHLDQLAPVLR